MKRSLTTLFFVLFLWFVTIPQSKFYFTLCERGDSLFHAGKFLQSAQTYEAAFASFDRKGLINDRYYAARGWAKANQPDSALSHLETIVYKGRYAGHDRLTSDSDFNSLHNNKRWKNLIDTSKAINAYNKNRAAISDKLFEPELSAQLDSIRNSDQYYRNQHEEIEKLYGYNSKEIILLWNVIRYQDSINLVKVMRILDTRGWLGPEIVHGGGEALFLVIQHSDINTQLKYLPMMRDAAKNRKLDKASLAMLEDRVLLRQNKEQIYGTQVTRDSVTGKRYVSPLIDPDNVDMRRAEVGLGPISDYVSYWGLVWDSEAYKTEMADRKRKTKVATFLNTSIPK